VTLTSNTGAWVVLLLTGILAWFGLREVDQVAGSHDGDGAGGDHQPLEHIWVQLLALTAAAVQTLHSVAEQRLVLRREHTGGEAYAK